MDIDGLVEGIRRISVRGNGIVATVAVTPASYPGAKVKGLWLSIDVAEAFLGTTKVPQLIYTHKTGLLFYDAKDGEALSACACIVRGLHHVPPDFDMRTAGQKAYDALRELLETNPGVQMTETNSSGLAGIIGYSAIGEMTL
ncbi:hypothetical protein HYV82_02930 [Candidatus Woesearchaeota archaeon]|nr:hypothetical protein [Candidatus Woesearchaeota archaeon]